MNLNAVPETRREITDRLELWTGAEWDVDGRPLNKAALITDLFHETDRLNAQVVSVAQEKNELERLVRNALSPSWESVGAVDAVRKWMEAHSPPVGNAPE